MMRSCIIHHHFLCVAKRVLMCNTLIISKKWWGCNTIIMLMLNMLNFYTLDFFVDLVPNLDPTPQESFPPMQDEHGDAMELNEWVHEGSKMVLQGECMH
jgi:hypothetical protein